MVHPPLTEAAASFTGESTAAELTSWLDAIAEITRAANRGAPLTELLDLIAGATSRLTGYDFCAVLEEDQERQSLLIKGSYGLSQEYVDAINARTPIPVRAGHSGEGPSSRAFRSQRPTTVFDIFADPPSRSWESVAAHQGYCSLLSVPVVVGQSPFGLLNCYTVDKHEFTAREIILMESMANQAGLAIETTHRLAAAHARAGALAGGAAAQSAALDALRHADADHEQLLHVVLTGGGLSAIAESLAAMLACTVVIDDPEGRMLASAGRGQPGGRAAAAYEQARAGVGSTINLETVAIAPGPGRPAGSAGLMVPVVLDEEAAGHVWALGPRAPFGEPHRQALVRAAAVVALALLKERTAQEVEWRLSRDFLDDLLEAEGLAGQAAEALHARARRLGADLTRPHTLLVIRRDPTPGEPAAATEDSAAYAQRSLLAIVQRTGAGWQEATLTATRSDHVVVLWHDDGDTRSATEFAHHLRREIGAYAAGWTATISIGATCLEVGEYGDAYRLTCGVLDLVQHSGRGDRVVSLDTIGAYRLLLQVKRPRELQAFAEFTLGTVHAYDQAHRTQLGSTLRGYLAQRCNVAATATTLHVHPNTVSYRLRRIEELLGIDLADPQALLHVQLAHMIEGILGD